jgi:predicted Ser/Thr protein kinase
MTACEPNARAIVRRRPGARERPPRVAGPSGVLVLQRAVGNRALARALGGEAEAPSPVLDVIGRGGQPLPGPLRSDMERRLGHEFSDVRIHTDHVAHVAACSIDAQALTSGRDIAFAPGRWASHTATGRETLAPELAHVVQQRQGPVSATPVGEVVQRLLDRAALEQIAFTERKAIKFLFWTHEMSTRYGAVLDRLDDYHGLIGKTAAGAERDAVDAALARVHEAADTYLAAHTGRDEPRLAGLVTLEADIVEERAAIAAVAAASEEPEELTWAEAIDRARGASKAAAAATAPAAWRRSVAPGGKRPVRPVKNLKPTGRPLAKGGFGAIYTSDLENAIIKKSLEPRRQQSFKSELKRQAKVPRHQNVMKVLGATVDKGGQVEDGVLKFIRGGTLKSALDGLERAYRRGTIDWRLYAGVQQRFAADIFAGLAHLHGAGVVHADIHAGNVVLGHIHGRAKLIDYTALAAGEPVNIGHYYGGFAPEAAALYPESYTTSVGKLGQQRFEPKPFADVGATATLEIHKKGGAQALDVFRAGLLVTEHLEDVSPLEIRALGQFWALASSFTREYSKMPSSRPTAKRLLSHPYLQPENMLIGQDEYEEALKKAGVKLTARKPRAS